MRYFIFPMVLTSFLVGCSRSPTNISSVALPVEQSRMMEAFVKLPSQPGMPPLTAAPGAKMPAPPRTPEDAVPSDLPGIDQLHKIPSPEQVQGMGNAPIPNGGQNVPALPNMSGMPHMPQFPAVGMPPGLNNGQPSLPIPIPVPAGLMPPTMSGLPVELPSLTPPTVEISPSK